MQDLGGLGFRGWYKDPGRVLERLSSFFLVGLQNKSERSLGVSSSRLGR